MWTPVKQVSKRMACRIHRHPIIDPFSQKPMRARINLPDGFEYTVAEMGAGTSKVNADLKLELNGSYGQFSIIHMNQDGVIR